jgi:curved DNA-binding protein CbpA
MQPSAPLDPYAVLQVLPTADDEVIRAAFRALAFKFHPDRDASEYAAEKMRELNLAYAAIKTPAARAAFDRRRRLAERTGASEDVALPPPVSLPADSRSSKLAFGRYSGWTLSQVARYDPEYLRWLARHSSGMRYRPEIERLFQTRGTAAV